MASKKIKGITIAIGGDTTELQKALKEPEKEAKSLKGEISEIDRALKLDPSNLDLLTQKSAVLEKEVVAVNDKLRILKDATKGVQDQVSRGEVGEEQYRAFQREIIKTEQQLKKLEDTVKDNNKQLDEAKKPVSAFGKAVAALKGDYEQAEQGATSFSDIVKGSAIGNLIASGIKTAGRAIMNFAADGAQAAKDYETSLMKLSVAMSNTTNATDKQVAAVVALIEQEERLGVVSKQSQTAAAQELATYVTKQQSIEKLIPVMNNMIAQQYGVNASQEAATGIATGLGKVLNGQVGALSRWGYSFTEAQANIIKGNDELRKLEVIIDIVNESVGGMNHTLAATTKEGQNFQRMLELGDVQEKFGTKIDEMKNSLLMSLLPAITTAVSTLNDFLTNNARTFESFGNVIAFVSNALAGLLKIVAGIPPGLLIAIASIIMMIKMFTSVTKGIEGIQSAIKAVASFMDMKANPTMLKTIGIVLAIIAALTILLALIVAIKEGWKGVEKTMKSVSNAKTDVSSVNIKGYASGTRSAPRGLAWVGEKGPELVNFRGGEQVYTAGQSARMAQGKTSYSYGGDTYHISVQSVKNLDEIIDWYQNRRRRERMGVA